MKSSQPSYHRVPDEEGSSPKPVSMAWQRIWRGINALMVIFFTLSAYVQHNDPDPYIWIPAYLVPAILGLAITVSPQTIGHPIWRTVCLVHLVLCFVGSLYLIAVVIDVLVEKGVDNPLVHEEGRELAGLVIISIWLAVARFSALGNPENCWSSGKSLLCITCVFAVCPLLFWGLCYVENMQHLGHCTDMFHPLSKEL